MQDGEERPPHLVQILRVRSLGRTCQAQNSQEGPVPAQRATPPPATAARSEPPDSRASRGHLQGHTGYQDQKLLEEQKGKATGTKRMPLTWRESKRKKKPSVLGVTCRKEGRGETHQHTAPNMQLRMLLPFETFRLPAGHSGVKLNSLAGPSKVVRPRALAAMSGRLCISGLCTSARGPLCLQGPLPLLGQSIPVLPGLAHPRASGEEHGLQVSSPNSAALTS